MGGPLDQAAEEDVLRVPVVDRVPPRRLHQRPHLERARLEGRDDVDATRIGVVGWSLGGYYAPRAAAFEKRFALCVAWGANHDWVADTFAARH